MASFVAYYRVSTARQGQSGLGLEAQKKAVVDLIAFNGNKLVGEFTEVESGKKNDRPQLAKAIQRCQATGATLIVAKLDRLSRNAAFLMTLKDSGVDIMAADMPEANTMMVGMMALVAQHEREAISKRTKEALAAAKARGVKLGGVRKGSPVITQYAKKATAARKEKADKRVEVIADDLKAMLDRDLSLNAMARELNEQEVRTPRGGKWSPTAVKRAIQRLP